MKFAEQLLFAALTAWEQNVARLCKHRSTSLGEELAGCRRSALRNSAGRFDRLPRCFGRGSIERRAMGGFQLSQMRRPRSAAGATPLFPRDHPCRSEA
jgi:hypothetical protein